MTIPDDKQKKSPVDRFHQILSNTPAGDKEMDQRPNSEVIARLPKKPGPSDSSVESPAPPASDAQSGLRLNKSALLPAFWTFASVISIAVNIVLLVVLITVLRGLGSVNATGLGSGLLGGLYTNFERMDQARIRTNILVQDSIPLNMNIPVQTTTGITLAQDVVIQNARVKISTATFNIDSLATVTLPAGTFLNVVLDFSVPVQTQVPITLNVPVDIPVQETELHQAITGLQTTIKPLYCIMAPTALSLSGVPVCR